MAKGQFGTSWAVSKPNLGPYFANNPLAWCCQRYHSEGCFRVAETTILAVHPVGSSRVNEPTLQCPIPPLLDLDAIPNPVLKAALAVAGGPLKKWLAVDQLNEVHEALVRTGTSETFCSRLLELVGCRRGGRGRGRHGAP